MAFPESSDVTSGTPAKASEYNNLRSDALSFFKGGDGSDGALNVSSGTTQIDCSGTVNGILVKKYTSVTIASGATVEFTNVPSSGVTLVILCQGDWSVAGDIDGAGDGTAGGASVGVSRTSNGSNILDGNDATDVDSVLRLGQVRKGSGGIGHVTSTGSGVHAASSGGSAGANPYSDGGDSTAATASTASAAAKTGGATITTAILNILGNLYGVTLFCGAGGASGGVGINTNGYSSGTLSATSGNAGRGGASIVAFIGGSYSHTGTVDLSGTAASASSTTLCTIAGTNVGQAASAGGSAGGAAGCFAAFVRGAITNSGAYTLTGGTSTGGSSNDSGLGGGAGSSAQATTGGTAPSGKSIVVPMP